MKPRWTAHVGHVPTEVHILSSGRALCGFSVLAPAFWPPEHRWVGREQADACTCPRCLAALGENDLDPLCDFCCVAGERPVLALLTEDVRFTLDGDQETRVSKGAWYCCRWCFDCIERGDRVGLSTRAMEWQLGRRGIRWTQVDIRDLGELRADLMRIHAAALDQLQGWPRAT